MRLLISGSWVRAPRWAIILICCVKIRLVVCIFPTPEIPFSLTFTSCNIGLSTDIPYLFYHCGVAALCSSYLLPTSIDLAFYPSWPHLSIDLVFQYILPGLPRPNGFSTAQYFGRYTNLAVVRPLWSGHWSCLLCTRSNTSVASYHLLVPGALVLVPLFLQ